MSLIAQVWADSVIVGNANAKSLLCFLARQNFETPGIKFKRERYAEVLELSERAIIRAFNHLEDKQFIKREKRFDKYGRQISNCIYLNIPEDFIKKFNSLSVDKSSREGDRQSPLGVSHSHPRGDTQTPTPPKKQSKYAYKSSTCRAPIFANSNMNNNINNKGQASVFFEQQKKNQNHEKPEHIKKLVREMTTTLKNKRKLKTQGEEYDPWMS